MWPFQLDFLIELSNWYWLSSVVSWTVELIQFFFCSISFWQYLTVWSMLQLYQRIAFICHVYKHCKLVSWLCYKLIKISLWLQIDILFVILPLFLIRIGIGLWYQMYWYIIRLVCGTRWYWCVIGFVWVTIILNLAPINPQMFLLT